MIPVFNLIRQTFSVKRLLKALEHSWDGLRYAWREPPFFLEILLSFVLVPTALLLQVSTIEKLFLISSWGAVMVVELINSAIETLIDRIGRERHPLSKKVKDLGSSAVFLTLLIAAVLWGIIISTRFIDVSSETSSTPSFHLAPNS